MQLPGSLTTLIDLLVFLLGFGFVVFVHELGHFAAARWAEMSAPTVVEGYSATWYADKESQNDMLRSCIDMQTAISLGHLPPDTTTQWKTATGDFVVVGVNDLVTVRLLLSQRQQTMYTKEATLKAQIDAATTVADVESVVW